jgi:hypothetical protein
MQKAFSPVERLSLFRLYMPPANHSVAFPTLKLYSIEI